jgi:hypothetical protein
MKLLITLATAVAFCLPAGIAHAAWGDIGYNPTPDPFDEDKAAQFDAFGLLAHAVTSVHGRSKYIQNFESGFTAGQRIDDWVTLGNTRVRFGAGSNLQSIQWQASIGGIDPYASEFGMTHPHGIYGNAPGVLDQPRNYVADLHFLTFAPSTAPTYVVMQFEQPISLLGFSMIDYAAGTGGNANLSLWNGPSLDSLVALPLSNGRSNDRTLGSDEIAGDFSYWIANGTLLPPPVNQFPSFNFAILRLDAQDSSVGFDNIIVGVTAVPEPETNGMMIMGLMALGITMRRRSSRKNRGS